MQGLYMWLHDKGCNYRHMRMYHTSTYLRSPYSHDSISLRWYSLEWYWEPPGLGQLASKDKEDGKA